MTECFRLSSPHPLSPHSLSTKKEKSKTTQCTSTVVDHGGMSRVAVCVLTVVIQTNQKN